MKFNQTPHPTIEDHHYIQDLINAQERRSNDRTYHRDRLKALEERTELISDSKPFDTKDFWCQVCKEDFKSEAVKQVETDWSNTTQQIAFYKTKCFKGHWCMRLVTDRHKDGYFTRSKRMAMERGKHFADTIQPWETGFNMLYAKKNN